MPNYKNFSVIAAFKARLKSIYADKSPDGNGSSFIGFANEEFHFHDSERQLKLELEYKLIEYLKLFRNLPPRHTSFATINTDGMVTYNYYIDIENETIKVLFYCESDLFGDKVNPFPSFEK